VTAVMIVMLALLNDGAILSIAYDNVHYRDKPEAWDMRTVLGISTVLGTIGVVAAFGLFYLGLKVFHLDHAHIQTLMYLKLSVAGHLTIFLTRTRGPFWSIRPAKILWMAVLGTQTVATLIAVYGLFMTPLGWGWAGFVWGYALVWFLINDRLKLLAYKIFDSVKAKSKPEAKDVNKPDAEEKTKPEAKDDNKSDAEDKTKPDAKDDNKSDAEDKSKPDAKDKTKPGVKSKSKPKEKDEDKSEIKVDTKPEEKGETKPEEKAKITSDLTQGMVERVHELYEELGRKDVQAVEEMEKAKREDQKDKTNTDDTTEDKKSSKEKGA